MRSIKFRAWGHGTDGEYKMFSSLDIKLIPWGDVLMPYLYDGPVCDHTLMQYTGLKDKNGVGIYEGDVCRDDTGSILEIKFGELPLDKSGGCACTYKAFYAKDYGKLGQAPFHECTHIGNWFEVIGNIHQNPKLLES